MDAFDRRLLLALDADGNLANDALAERVGLSPSQCYRRRLRLEQAGAIQGYRAVIDQRILGFLVTAFVRVSLVAQSSHERKKFAIYLSGEANVLSCHAITGDADYLLKVRATDLGELNTFLLALLRHGAEKMHVSSLIALETVKDS